MRRIILWLTAALLILTACASAESTASAVNGEGAARTSSELYTIFNDNGEDVLMRVSSSGAAVCVDRADDIDSVVPYVGGMAYLKTDDGVSEIIQCSGNRLNVIYRFEGMTCEKLSVYGDTLLVESGNLLYSVNPDDQICLKLSGAQVLDYCVGGNYAYYLSGTDMMKYSADVTENGETVSVSSEVGCIYRLDLTSGETTLMLKSGGTDLKIKDNDLFFHSMQQIYAVRTDVGYELRGKLYSLNVSEKTLNAISTENDLDYWLLDNGAAIRTESSLVLTGNKNHNLYDLEADAQVVSDGSALYVWEPSAGKVTRVTSAGTTDVLYTGALNALSSIEAAATPVPEVPEVIAEPAPEAVVADPTAIPGAETSEVVFTEPISGDSVFADAPESTDDTDTAWFDDFMQESENVTAAQANPTPIGATPTPSPLGSEVVEQPSAPSYPTPVPDSQLTKTQAVSQTSVTIVDSAANVRIGPGTTFEKIGSIPQGAVAELMGLSAQSVTNTTTWYKVYYNGMTGWVSSMYAKPGNAKVTSKAAAPAAQEANVSTATENVSSTTGTYAHIHDSSVNLRAMPSLDGEILTSVPVGAYADFSGKYSIDDQKIKWYKVTYNGTTGWVSAKFADITDTKSAGSASKSSASSSSSSSKKVRTTGNVTIRKSADKTSKKLGYIPGGTNVTYLGSSKVDYRGVRWYKIKYNGVTGWISSKFSKLK